MRLLLSSRLVLQDNPLKNLEIGYGRIIGKRKRRDTGKVSFLPYFQSVK
jgi:hypothetical protein